MPSQVDFNGAVLHVRRVKNGTPSTDPLLGDELRALRRLRRESPSSPFVFVSERGTPFTTAGFARMIERASRKGLGLELKAHPHMLRHACGHALANKGHDTRAIQGWLGHRSITSTAVYTALAPIDLRISGGSKTSDYFLTDDFANVRGGRRRPCRKFAQVQAVGKKMRIASTAPDVDGIEIEIAGRFVSLWKATCDKFRHRIAERIK